MEKRTLFLILMLSSVFVSTWFISAYGKDEDEKKMDAASSSIDKDSHDPGEAQKVEDRLEKKFNVTDERIDSLRRQKLGFGEINIVLSMARQMPGGITDQNIDKIMDLRQGQGGHKEGWGEIAHDLNLRLGSAARDVDDMGKAIREEMFESKFSQEARENGIERHEAVEESRGVESHGEIGFRADGGMGHQK